MSDLQCPARVFLARHGEAEYESPVMVNQGGSLTTLGRTQARELAEKLRGERIAHVYCSTISRAVQTAELAAGVLGVEVTVREGLGEFAVGEAYGKPAGTGIFVEEMQRWVAGDIDATYPGSESAAQVVARVRSGARRDRRRTPRGGRAGGCPRRSRGRHAGGARVPTGPDLGLPQLLVRRARGRRVRLASLRLGNPQLG